jgi:hypothetical protein
MYFKELMLSFPTLAIAAALSFAAQPGDNAPQTYTAATDQAPRPKPPLPPMGLSGTVIHDPTFGSRILRVTDGQTQRKSPDASFRGPSGSFVNNWNADSTMFWVYGRGGIVPFRFDPERMAVSRVGDTSNEDGGLVLPDAGPFSYQRPSIIYQRDGVKIREYDFNTSTSVAVFDAQEVLPGVQGSYTPSASDDDNRICMAVGGMQDTHPYVVVLDRRAGRYHVLDTGASKVDGRDTRIPLGFGIHSAYIDRSGRYVVVGKGQGRQPNTSEWVVWDVDTGNVAEITNHWSGHDASGFGVRVNESGYSGGNPSFYEEVQYCIRPLDPDHVSEARYLIDEANLPTPHVPITGGHFSWNNARPDVLVPIVGSHFREVKNASAPWRALDDEIIAVATDGSGTVWRFAHHRSLTDGDFWDTPRGNVSQNGRWFLFTSNWERTLGWDPYDHHARQDMFIVELPAPREVAAAPAQPPTEPAPVPDLWAGFFPAATP